MLEVSRLTTRYGAISALRDADLHVGSGEVVGLIGPNGAGKTTLLGSIAGLLAPAAGSVTFEGTDITGQSPEKLLRLGVALVPEHRRIFGDLTVEENLKIGGITQSRDERAELLDEMGERFPVLREKRTVAAGYLSGGELSRSMLKTCDGPAVDDKMPGHEPFLPFRHASWTAVKNPGHGSAPRWLPAAAPAWRCSEASPYGR